MEIDRHRTRRHWLIEFAPGDGLRRIFARYPFIGYRSADLSRKDVDERVDLTAMTVYHDRSVDVLLCLHATTSGNMESGISLSGWKSPA
jgi:hypothetical protein